MRLSMYKYVIYCLIVFIFVHISTIFMRRWPARWTQAFSGILLLYCVRFANEFLLCLNIFARSSYMESVRT